jgi:hypothetical protein
MHMHVSPPKVPKCTCHANACSRRDIIIYLFFKSCEQDHDNRLMIESSSDRTRISILRISWCFNTFKDDRVGEKYKPTEMTS